MSILNEKSSLVLIIDIQDKLLNAVFNRDILSKKAGIIAKSAATLGIPVIVTEQYPKGLGGTIEPIKSVLDESTTYFEKTSFSAIENSGIANAVDKSDKKQIIVLGIETHICVSQTVNALKEKGYDVTVISDACGSRSEIEHNAGLERIRSNGAKTITAEIAIFEWLKSARHVKFKELQALIK